MCRNFIIWKCVFAPSFINVEGKNTLQKIEAVQSDIKFDEGPGFSSSVALNFVRVFNQEGKSVGYLKTFIYEG